jgi:drug/metabolite transporter (DMT)-like permease
MARARAGVSLVTTGDAVRRERMDLFGAGVLVGFSALLGLNQALVKLVNAGFAPVFQSGLRSICAFLPVLLYALWARKRLSLTDGSLGPGIVNGLLFSGEFCALFLALDYTSVARASLFFYTMPLWVAVGAHFLLPGERLTPARAAGLCLAVAGVALALTGSATRVGDDAWIGDLLALTGAVFWAGIALVTRTTRLAHCSPEMNLLYQLAVSAIVLTALAPLFGDLVRDVTLPIIGIFTFQVIVVVAIGFVVWFWVLSVYPVADMASFSLLTPVSGIFFGWLIFDDHLPPGFVVALLLVGAGLVLVNRPRA